MPAAAPAPGDVALARSGELSVYWTFRLWNVACKTQSKQRALKQKLRGLNEDLSLIALSGDIPLPGAPAGDAERAWRGGVAGAPPARLPSPAGLGALGSLGGPAGDRSAEDAAGGSLTAACVLLLRSHVGASERRDPVLLTVSLRVLP